MGDTEQNVDALAAVVGAALPLYAPSIDARRWAADVPEAYVVIDLDTATQLPAGSPQLFEWTGYGLEIAVAGTTPGAAVRVNFGNARTTGLILYPGERLEVPRGFERLYLESAGAAGTVRTILSRDPFNRHIKGTYGTHLGDSAGQVDVDTGAVAPGARVTLLDSDSFRHLDGVPLCARLQISGGQMERGISNADDFPGELLYRTFRGSTEQPRCYLAPGGAWMLQINLNIYRNRARAAVGDPNRWRLEFLNPAGSLANKSVQVQGEVLVGSIAEGPSSGELKGWEHITTPGPVLANKYALDATGGGRATSSPQFRFEQAATGQAATFNSWSYVPTVFGGPFLMLLSSSAVASAAGLLKADGAPWQVARVFWAVAPGAATARLGAFGVM